MNHTLVTLPEAAAQFTVNKRTLQRRVADGSLKPAGTRKGKSGQRTNVFRVSDILKVLPRRKIPFHSSQRFFDKCIGHFCDPRATLLKLLFANGLSTNGEEFLDLDVARAGIKLVREGHPSFLKMLSDKEPLGKDFASALAKRLGPEKGITIEAMDTDYDPEDFHQFLCACKKLVRQGFSADPEKGIGEFGVDRDLVAEARPRWLDSIAATDVPGWAQQSVVPYHERRTVREALDTVSAAAAEDPKLQDFLQTVKRDLAKLKPVAGIRSEQAQDRDGATAEAIGTIGTNLTKDFGVPKGLARRFCHGLHRRMHHEAFRDLRECQASGFLGPAGRRKSFPVAVVNRVFDLSPSAKL